MYIYILSPDTSTISSLIIYIYIHKYQRMCVLKNLWTSFRDLFLSGHEWRPIRLYLWYFYRPSSMTWIPTLRRSSELFFCCEDVCKGWKGGVYDLKSGISCGDSLYDFLTPMEILMFLDEISMFPWFSYGVPPCRIDIMGIYAEKHIYLYKDTKNVMT